MTRILTDGAEMADLLWWDYITSPGGDDTVQPTSSYPGGSGAYVYRWMWGSGGHKDIGVELSELYFRCRFRGDGIYHTDGTHTFRFSHDNNDLVVITTDKLEPTHLVLWVGATTVQTSTLTVASSTWYLLQVYVKISDTSGSVVAKINGIEYLNYSGDTKPGADTTVNRLRVYSAATNFGSTTLVHDDYALNDLNGSVDNSWPNSGRIEKLAVNSNGDLNEWTPSSGSAWECVDDIPPNGETDYISSRLSGQRDMFNLEAFTDTNKTVQRIWIEGRAEDYAAMASKVKLGFKTSGSVFMGSEATLPSTYKRVTSGEFLVDPTSNKVWTKTELDALQAVVESV